MSKPPPPNGQIAPVKTIAKLVTETTHGMDRLRFLPEFAATPEDDDIEGELERRMARTVHDAAMARAVAAELAAEWQREQVRPAPPPRRPGEGEVPAERFGPGDRRVGSERK